MGGSHSTTQSVVISREQLLVDLDRKVAAQFDSLELSTFYKVFDQLATPAGNKLIWTEDTFVKFLELPDEVGSLTFLSASFVASHPFEDESPAVLTREALLRTIAVMLGRTTDIMGQEARKFLLYKSFAVGQVLSEKEKVNAATDLRIRRPELLKLIQFLMTIQQKKPTEVVSHYIERFSSPEVVAYAASASSVVSAISQDDQISFEQLSRFIATSPGILSPIKSLYSHFLFPTSAGTEASVRPRSLDAQGLLNNAIASQLGLFLPRELIYGKLDALYRASHDGFSMGSFESKVLRYPGPTVLLLTGESDDHVATRYGLYSEVPWKQSSKETFGDHNTVLLQLSPQHQVLKGTDLRHHTWFAKSLGIGIGCLPPSPSNKKNDYSDHSLLLDTSLEYATVRDESAVKHLTRITIEDVEVWGLGGDKEAQRKAWEWEENEANRRRNINIKDMQADYDLLEMAGLVGQNRSGGSI